MKATILKIQRILMTSLLSTTDTVISMLCAKEIITG